MPGKSGARGTGHAEAGNSPREMFAALAVPNFRPYVSGQALSPMALP